MSKARTQILGAVRRSLRRGQGDAAATAAATAATDERLAARRRGPVPARGQVPHREQVDLFAAMAVEHAATVARLPDAAAVPGAVAEYLRAHNLPPEIRIAPDPALATLPWDGQPLLKIAAGRAEATDPVSLTAAFAGVAETGTLMLHSGPDAPTTLNFLPETHMVVLRASQVTGAYEDAWALLRAAYPDGALPRTVNFITGPSRTGDIEQTIQLGAHGPRRLHIMIVDDTRADAA